MALGLFVQIFLSQPTQIGARGLGPEWHVPVDPDPNLRAAFPQEIAAILGRNLHGEFQLAAAEAGLDLIGRRNVRLPVEEARAFEAVQELTALEGAGLVESGEAQVLDVERDAIAESEHQDNRTEQGESDPDWIA